MRISHSLGTARGWSFLLANGKSFGACEQSQIEVQADTKVAATCAKTGSHGPSSVACSGSHGRHCHGSSIQLVCQLLVFDGATKWCHGHFTLLILSMKRLQLCAFSYHLQAWRYESGLFCFSPCCPLVLLPSAVGRSCSCVADYF